jgi:hypothetical protein
MCLFVLAADIAGLVTTSTIRGNGDFLEASSRIIASETLYRIGLSAALVGTLATILLAIGLYAALRRVDGNLATTALSFRVVEAAVGAMGIVAAFNVLQLRLDANHLNVFDANQLGALAQLGAFGVTTNVAAIFFSLGSTIFFYLFLKASYIPRLLAGWGIFASVLYAIVWFISLIAPQYSVTVAYGSVPILIAEVGTGIYLLMLKERG